MQAGSKTGASIWMKFCNSILGKNKQMVNLELFFDQATEDASSTLRAMDIWPGKEHDYTAGHVATQVLSGYARCLRAKEQLARMDLPSSYAAYRDKLETLMGEVERRFASFTDAHRVELEALFLDQGELSARLSYAADLLRQSQQIYQEGQMFDNQQWITPELEDAEHGFLLLFSDLQRVAEVPPPLRETFSFKNWLTNFEQLTNSFRKIFGYFEQSREYLTRLQEREYWPSWWWLTDSPRLADVQEQEITPKMLSRIGGILRVAHCPEHCPEPEQVISYALGELKGMTHQTVQSHVGRCTECMDLVVKTRWAIAAAEEEATESQAPEPQMDSKLIWLNRLIASTYQSYDVLAQNVKSLAPKFRFPAKGSLGKAVASFMTTEWEATALPAAADTLDTLGTDIRVLTGTQIEIQNGEIRKIQPLGVILTHQQFRKGQLLLSGQVKPSSLLSESAYLVGAWCTPDGKTLWPGKDGVRFKPQTGEFLIRFQLDSSVEGSPRFLIVVSS
jgi:hypothetical protein